MIEDVKRNKIKTGFIVSVFIVVITLILYYIGVYFDFGPFAIIFALGFSIISAWASYYNSDKIVLSLNKARPATHEEDQKLVNILDSLMASSGLKTKPRLYVVDSPQPNAFATGRDPEHAVICVTTALLDTLSYYELEGVIAHEMAHIKNYDIRLSAVVTVMVGLVVMLADICSRAMLYGGDRDNKNSNGFVIIIGAILLLISPIFSKLMQMAVSRRREFLADATAVEFTRNPDGLISALQKLDADTNKLETANSSTAHMYISNPFKKNANGKKEKTDWFSTHPPISARIEALRNIK